MEAKTNYTFVGTMVVLLIAGLIITSLWLSIGFDRKSYRSYGVYMHEAVSGLMESSLIKYNGVKVGYVDKIMLNQANPQEVFLKLRITTETPITVSTRATLISQGITGNTYLGLTAETPDLTPLIAKPGEPYPVIPYKPSFLNQLETTLNDISKRLKGILTPQNEAHFGETLTHLASVTQVVAKNNAHIDKSLRELPTLITAFEQTLKRFSAMAGDVSSAGKQVSYTMKTGQRSVDALTQQALPPAVVLLHRLDNTARNLEQLSNELRTNPTVLIRGHTPPKPGPGE